MKKILIIIILSLILPTLSNANQINISSDELNFDKLKHELIFTGNVYAYDGQIKIWSEILKVILNEDNSEIDKIFARKGLFLKNLNRWELIFDHRVTCFLFSSLDLTTLQLKDYFELNWFSFRRSGL